MTDPNLMPPDHLIQEWESIYTHWLPAHALPIPEGDLEVTMRQGEVEK